MHRFSRRARRSAILLAVACAPAAPPASLTVSTPVEIVVAATTDVHGRLLGWDYFANRPDTLRGLARASTLVDSIRAANPGRVVLVDAGDLFQGNPLTYVAARVRSFDPHPVIAAMNAMGYDAAAVGNHEFNYGVPAFESAIARARFPFLAANTTRLDGGRAFPGMTMVERAGVRIAIIGATTPGSMVWDRDHLAGRLRVDDVVPAVRALVASARDSARADAVVVVVHSGLEGASSYDTAATGLASENVSARLAREIPGIDLIVFGHSHREIGDTVIAGTRLMQPRNWAASVAVATLTIGDSAGRRRVIASRGLVIPVGGRAEDPGVVAAVAEAHRATVEYATTPIGTTPVAWPADSARVKDAAITDFVLEVMRRAAKADLAATAVFSLRGGLDAGPITIAELAQVYPYDNTLRAVRISGRQLRDFLEYSARYYRVPSGTERIVDPSVAGYNFDIVAGAEYVLDITRPVGRRVTSLSVNGRPVAAADTFTMALNNYRQTGGGGFSMLAGAPLVYDRDEDIRQLLIDEVRAKGSIRPSEYHTENWRLEPAALHPRLRREQLGDGFDQPVAGRRSPVTLRIIATNDIHGGLEPRADSRGVTRGGLANLAAAADSAARACPEPCEVLLLDGGDMFQGTPASNFLFGKPVVEAMNVMGYAAAALGNHEFDWGQDTLRARMRDARFSILGANVRDSAGRDVPWIPNDTIVRRGPLRVGIVGIANERTPTMTKAGNTDGLRFDPPAPIVDSAARSLRARGADVVIVVAHIGAFCDQTGARNCGGGIIDLARALRDPVDAIVSGHTHSRVDAVVGRTPIVQAFSSASALAVLDLPVDTTRLDDAGRIVSVYPTTPPHPPVHAITAAAVERVAPVVNRPVGELAAALPKEGDQHPAGNFVADAQRFATGADLAVMNNGGIRSGLAAGPATYGSLYEVQPFGNRLMVATVAGATLQSYLERVLQDNRPDVHISGAVVRYDPKRPAGSRVVSVRMADGTALRPTKTYRVALNDFMASGGDQRSFGPETLALEPANMVDIDALIAYLQRQPGPLAPPRDRRFVEVNR